MEKLHSALPPEYKEYVHLADHFTEDKYDRVRRAILARGNDCKRVVLQEMCQYEFSFVATPDVNKDSTTS